MATHCCRDECSSTDWTKRMYQLTRHSNHNNQHLLQNLALVTSVVIAMLLEAMIMYRLVVMPTPRPLIPLGLFGSWLLIASIIYWQLGRSASSRSGDWRTRQSLRLQLASVLAIGGMLPAALLLGTMALWKWTYGG